MTVRLRAHHLLCLLTYVGRGYSPAFAANMDRIAARLGEGLEDVLVVDGPDDLCAPLLGTADEHCLERSARDRDERAAADLSAHLGSSIRIGTVLSSRALADLRPAFASGAIRSACRGCPWSDLCDTVAKAGFLKARLLPPDSPGSAQ